MLILRVIVLLIATESRNDEAVEWSSRSVVWVVDHHGIQVFEVDSILNEWLVIARSIQCYYVWTVCCSLYNVKVTFASNIACLL